MRTKPFLCFVLGYLFGGLQAIQTFADKPHPIPVGNVCEVDDLAGKLAAIEPFQKPHLSYPLKEGIRSRPRVFKQYVRITNACSVRIGVHDEYVEQCVEACELAGERCTITVNYSPLKKDKKKLEAYAAAIRKSDPSNAGRLIRLETARRLRAFDAEFLGEVERFGVRFESIVKRSKPVRVGHVLFDHETYHPKPNDEPASVENLDVLRLSVKLNVFALAALAIEPAAVVHYYNAGSRRETGPSVDRSGWTGFLAVPENLVISHWSGVSAYWPTELYHFRESIRRSSEKQPVFVWLSLASGWRRTPENWPKIRTWVWDYDYPAGYDWQRGIELNQPYYGKWPAVYTPNREVAGVVFYPAPGDDRVPCWWKRFLVYARGSHGIRAPP